MKRIKSNGKLDDLAYLKLTAKMTTYEVNVYERLIYVPENELDICRNELAVVHLCDSHNFHIQSCIPQDTIRTEIFNPSVRDRIITEDKTILKPYNEGELYKVVSTGSVMKIVRTELQEIELAYISYDERLGVKPNLIINQKQLSANLAKGVLKTYSQC